MTVELWLKATTKKLTAAGIGSANLDALILLEDEVSKDRTHLLAHPEIKLSSTQIKNLGSKLRRRLKHEPMAYIRGFSEFYGRNFLINKDVLEPRPESEAMIELVKELRLPKNVVIADIGTGSGAIAITVKLEFPAAKMLATEIDAAALKIAHENATKFDAKIDFFEGDLIAPIKATLDVILANLPYVPDKWQINQAAAMEPRIAIFGGPDGLDLYRRLFEQISDSKSKPKFVFTESLPPQHEALAKIAIKHNYSLLKTQDFIQVFELGAGTRQNRGSEK